MPWYTVVDAVNRPNLSTVQSQSIRIGYDQIGPHIADQIIQGRKNKNRPSLLALDGYLGARMPALVQAITAALPGHLSVNLTDINTLFKSRQLLEHFFQPYLTDDPSFGRVCKAALGTLMDEKKLLEFRQELLKQKRSGNSSQRPDVVICYGCGAALPCLRPLFDFVYYVDLSREALVRRLERGEVVPPGGSEPEDIYWKRLYYIFYPLLNRHKKTVFKQMDGYVDDNDQEAPKLLTGKVYDDIVSELVTLPLRFKRIFMPGPWGGEKFRKQFNLPQLANCAWNIEVSGGDSSLVVDVGNGDTLEIPLQNLVMQYPKQVVGPYCHQKYPGLFPIQVGIDDGYFAEPVPHERRAMPVHLHPDSRYTKTHFGEPLGRYEVYYIVEAYEGANTMHGFYEDADTDEFRKKVVDSEQSGEPFDWSKYIKCWPSKAGELYLIPAGTVHGTGGNQMVLEMDTCPSIVGTEYSFFLYDYQRPTWDDRKKSFTGKKVKLQIKHGLDQCRFNRREKWVAENIRPRAGIYEKGDGWSKERFDSYHPMPYHIERMNFDNKIEDDTKERFFHFFCLTRGEKVLIRSKRDPEKAIELNYIQTTVIPACFGDYECINLGSTSCTLTRQRWKRG